MKKITKEASFFLSVFFVWTLFFPVPSPVLAFENSFDYVYGVNYEPIAKLVNFLNDKKRELENFGDSFEKTEIVKRRPIDISVQNSAKKTFLLSAVLNPVKDAIIGKPKKYIEKAFCVAKDFVFPGACKDDSNHDYVSAEVKNKKSDKEELDAIRQQYDDAIISANELNQKFNLLQQELAKVKAGGVVVKEPIIEQKTVERTIEKIVSGLSQDDLSAGIALVKTEINNLNTNLTNQINNLSFNTSRQSTAAFNAISLTNRIDSLSGTRLSGITVNGVSGLTDTDIPDGITASNYLPLSGGTITGDLAITGTATLGVITLQNATAGYFTATSTVQASTFPYASSTALTVSGSAYIGSLNGPLQANNGLVSATTSVGYQYGGTGLTATPSFGQILRGTGSGYALVATSTLGINTDDLIEGANLFWTNNRFDNRLSSTTTLPNITTLASLASVGTITTGVWNGTTIAVNKGGTGQTSFGQGWLNSDGTTLSASTSPTVNYIVATSTTATSTFNGGMSVAGSSGLTVLQNGNVGIGTTTPGAKLDISTGNIDIDSTTNANQYGVITKDGTRFIHDFNYGNNGTVTTVGLNTFVGKNAGNLTMGSTATQTYEGSYNTANGMEALSYNTTGYQNTANGFRSIYFNTTGYENTANGVQSLYNNTTGYQNTANGYRTLFSNTTGYQNTANGFQAGYNSGVALQTNTNSVFIGDNANSSVDGLTNAIAIGSSAQVTQSNQVVLGNSSITQTILRGNVGIGTTSPYAKLSVVGEVVAQMFTATSTTATSTFAGGLSVAGHCVTGDTRLRRRRKKKNGEGYEYDEVAIKDIQPGDEIASLDEKSGKIVWSKVNALMDMGVKKIYKLTTASGKTIRTTAEHPYLVRNKEVSPKKAIAFIDYANIKAWMKGKNLSVDLKTLYSVLKDSGVSDVRFYYGTDAKNNKIGSFFSKLSSFGYSVITKPVQYFKIAFLELLKQQANTRWLEAIGEPIKTTLLKEASVLDNQNIELFAPKANFDVEISVDALKNSDSVSNFILFSGDGDFVYLLKELKKLGKQTVVVSGRKSLSGSLMKEADKFVTLERLGEKIPDLFPEKQNPPHGRVLKKCTSNIADLLGLSNCSVDNLATSEKGLWKKVVYLKKGMEIAVNDAESDKAVFDEITKIEIMPEEQVYDIEVEGTHNFIGNDIVAHNTYIGGTASSTNLIVSNSSALGTVSSGIWNGSLIATQYGGTGQNFSASSGLINLYSGTASAMATSSLGLLTTDVAEGTNQYWTNTRFDNRLSATTTLPNLTTLLGLTNASTTGLTVTGQTTLATSLTGLLKATSGVVSAITTSLGLAGEISDETGSGALVFGTSPTFTTQITTPSIVSAGALGITPNAGSNLNVNLSTTGDFAVNTNQLYVDTSSGNVGIGTTTPGALVDIYKNTGDSILRVEQGNGAYWAGVNLKWLTTNWYMKMGDSNFDIAQTLGGAPEFRITTGGNVGIGETVPGSKLSVSGGATIGASYDTTAAPTNGLLVEGNVGIGTTAPTSNMEIVNSGGATLGIHSNGSVASNKIIIGKTLTNAIRGEITSNNVGNFDINSVWDSGALTLSTQSVEHMRITATGNVGIGTTTPSSRLVVNDSTAQAQAIFEGYSIAQSRTNIDSGTIQIGNSAPGYHGLISYSGANNTDFTFDNSYDNASAVTQFRMRTLGTPVTAMTILGSGNVGIGTAAPVSKLEVAGGNIVVGGGYGLYRNYSGSARGIIYNPNGGTTTIRPTDNSATDGIRLEDWGGNAALFVRQDGNVGIGTTTPPALLTVGGTGTVAIFGDTVGDNVIKMGKSSNGAAILPVLTLGSTFQVGMTDSSIVGTKILGGGSSGIDILNNGNVGIGTTNPTGKLTIYDTTAGYPNPQLRLGYDAIRDYVIGRDNSTGFLKFIGNEATYSGFNFSTADVTNAVNIINNGNVGIGTTSPWRTLSVTGTVGFDGLTGATGAGSLCLDANKQVVYNSASDACLSSTRATKHDIQTLNLDGLSLINSLQPSSFIYNQGDGRTRYGFMAEDTALVDDRLATHNEKGDITGIDDRAILSVAVKAVKELNLKVSDLQASATASGGQASDSLFSWIIGKFSAIGIMFGQDKLGAKKGVFESFEMKDATTGEDYCVKIRNGEWEKIKGTCGETSLSASASAQASTTYSGETSSTLPVGDTSANISTSTLGEASSTPSSVVESISTETSSSSPLVIEPISTETSTTSSSAVDPIPTEASSSPSVIVG